MKKEWSFSFGYDWRFSPGSKWRFPPDPNTIKCDTEILGGISTYKWIWFGQASASIIFTPFHSHNCRNILPIAARFSL